MLFNGFSAQLWACEGEIDGIQLGKSGDNPCTANLSKSETGGIQICLFLKFRQSFLLRTREKIAAAEILTFRLDAAILHQFPQEYPGVRFWKADVVCDVLGALCSH